MICNIVICLIEHNGKAGHEIAFLLEAVFKDKTIYQQDNIQCFEENTNFIARWVAVDTFLSGEKILYPEGLAEFLQQQQ